MAALLASLLAPEPLPAEVRLPPAGVAEILPELGLLAGFGGTFLLAGAALLGRRLRRAPA